MTESPQGRARLEDHARLARARAAFVTDRLLVGGDLDSIDPDLARAQLAELVDRGVTHILDTRLEWSDEDYVARHAPGIAYLHLGVDDNGETLPDRWFDEATSWLDDALARPGTRALVHCHMGVNRSPSLVFAYLLHTGRGVRDSLDAIRAAWPWAVVDYADDALAWHHRRAGTAEGPTRDDVDALARWRDEQGIDPEQVIRSIRQDESVRLAARNLRLVAGVMRTEPGAMACWLFRMSADRAASCLADYRSGVDSWILPVGRHDDDIRPDDLFLLWQTGPDEAAGLFGYAMVNETRLADSQPLHRAEAAGTNEISSAVDAELAFVAPRVLVSATELRAWPEFAPEHPGSASLADGPNPFPVDADQLERIATLLQAGARH